MLQDIVAVGTTSYRGAIVRVVDSTDGTPETSVAYDTTGVDLWYRKVGGARTAITEATLAAVDSAYSSGGFKHISDGYCRLDLPDAALDTEGYVDFGGTFTGMIVMGGRIKVASATRGLAGTALPAAAADAAGGLIISDAGGLDADDLKADVTAILADTGTDGVIVASGTVTTLTNLPAITAGWLTATGIAADAITEAKIADAAISVEHVNAALYTRLGIIAYGTMQAGSTGTTAKLADATSFADDFLNGSVIFVTGGTGAGQVRVITDWTSTGDVATVDTWTTTPDVTSTYVVFAAPPASATSLPSVNVTQWLGTAAATPTTAGVPEVDVTHIAGAAVSATTAQLGVNVVNAAGTAWGSGAITAAALAADAVDEILDEVVEGSTTFRQALRILLATLAGKVSGAGTTTITFRDIADSTNRVVATVDESGNRSAVTLTLT